MIQGPSLTENWCTKEGGLVPLRTLPGQFLLLRHDLFEFCCGSGVGWYTGGCIIGCVWPAGIG